MDWKKGVLHRYAQATDRRPIDVVDAKHLSPEQFQLNYVNRCKPCLIRGAVANWPAFTKWREIEYLTQALGVGNVPGVRSTPEMELRWRGNKWGGHFAIGVLDIEQGRSTLPVSEFFTRIGRLEHLFSYAQKVTRDSIFGAIAGDIGRISFLSELPPARMYHQRRVFFFGQSYTDWHFHPTDETLMCQIGAAKRVALLGPGQGTWDSMFEVAREEVCLGTAEAMRFKNFAALEPHIFTVEPGDATYIPPYWWHAVETLQDANCFGATIAVCWASPTHVYLDPRFPARKFFLQHTSSPKKKAEFLAEVEWKWKPLHKVGKTLEIAIFQ